MAESLAESQIETANKIRLLTRELNDALALARSHRLVVNLETVPLRNIGIPDGVFIRTTVYKEV